MSENSLSSEIIEIIIQDKYKVLIYPKQKVFDLKLINLQQSDLGIYDPLKYEILIFTSTYTSYFKVSDAMLIHIKDDIYYLITSLVFRMKYEYEIKEIIFENYLISIFSNKGLLTIVKDHYDNYFCIEIDSYFEKRNKENEIAKILNKQKYRYIPCIEMDF